MNNKKLVIIGAGSLGVMTLDIALSQGEDIFSEIIFVDDGKAGDTVHGYDVVGPITMLDELQGDFVAVIAIANNKVRKAIAEKYKLHYINLIHPKAVISTLASIGTGNIILPNVSVDPEAVIGNHVVVNKNTSLGHNVILGDYSQVSPGCQLAGEVGELSFLGLGASLLPYVKIGKEVTVGSGAVVVKDTPDNVTLVGVPAKII